MDKAKLVKAAGAGVASLMLLALIQDMRSEMNDLRERIVRLETMGDTHDNRN